MKTLKSIFLMVALFAMAFAAQAQKRNLDNYRSPDKDGLNVFEAPKDTASTYEGIKVRMGGAFALQYQSINHENSGNAELIEIGDNFNLATANLDIDVALYDGVNLHLRTYLSSRHHPEPYVKGGYLQIDKLDFIKEGFMEDVMQYVTIKLGHMENNYGDAHFRRSDNAMALYNPFVGNYLMDGFTTEVGGEVYFRKNAWMVMAGLSNGKLNQAVNNPGTTSPSFIGKLGWDKQINVDLRVRLTGSVYSTAHSSRTYLYAGDRAGSRYYFVMENPEATSSANYSSGRVNPMYNARLTAVMFNPFVKYKGLEFFGLVERADGKNHGDVEARIWNQYAAELIYRFGKNENMYVGGRYNLASGELFGTQDKVDITRFNVGAGWFLTKNILTKLEYVNQTYDGYPDESIFNEGKFNGLVVEAVISF